MNEGKCIVFGLSAFNSFFTPGTVRTLIRWGADHFDRVEVLLPGYEASFAAIAAGSPPLAAVRKVKHAVKNLRSPARNALEQAGLAPATHTWTKKAGHPRYRDLSQQVAAAYESSERVRQWCDRTTSEHLRQVLDTTPTPGQVALNRCYVLAELPYLMDAAGVVDAPSAVFAYPHSWPLQEALLNGEIPELMPADRHGFVKVSISPRIEEKVP
ncbi:tRNA-dependent cyclodipeptide synthase [Streptomyces sp. FIT100]|nr:tRNA-dependent cyclodipeptide synthase [Streptomyces sp. FIT100]